MVRNQHHTTLGVISLGLAVGISWALFVLCVGIAAGLFGWGANVVIVLQSIYVGYAPTLLGAISGAVWGFVNGLVGGALIAWLYNRFLLIRQRPFRRSRFPAD